MAKPFVVAWKNPSEPIKADGRNLVECEICKKRGHPFDFLGCYELPIESKMYEYPFWVCSESCDKAATKSVKNKRIKELS